MDARASWLLFDGGRAADGQGADILDIASLPFGHVYQDA